MEKKILSLKELAAKCKPTSPAQHAKDYLEDLRQHRKSVEWLYNLYKGNNTIQYTEEQWKAKADLLYSDILAASISDEELISRLKTLIWGQIYRL